MKFNIQQMKPFYKKIIIFKMIFDREAFAALAIFIVCLAIVIRRKQKIEKRRKRFYLGEATATQTGKFQSYMSPSIQGCTK